MLIDDLSYTAPTSTWRARGTAYVVVAGLVVFGCGDDSGDANGDTGAGTSGETGLGDTSGDTSNDTSDDGSDVSLDDTSDDADGSETGSRPGYAEVYPLVTTFPEGAAFDPTDALFYFGTLAAGEVHRLDPETGESTMVFEASAPGQWITLGMAVDEPGRKLWVCAADRETTPFTGQLWVIDLVSGERESAIPLMAGRTPAWCEDVAVAPDGTAYATDRENPNIYRVAEGQSELFASDPVLGSDGIGQNGIVVLPDDAGLLAAIHLPASLNHISMEGEITTVAIDGPFEDTGIGAGADGMVYVDGDLYVVFDGKLAHVTPTADDWSAATSTMVERPRGLTDIVNTPAGLYLINGQAIQFALGQDPIAPFEIVLFDG
ncbi:MAG: SMP-30/gluconolactonase/LRE family protein [Nannocystaceae bacterium]|nr:SMP-30/gluconolactonase/LRE family protein [Nannocystaceae bacterium]